MAKQRLSEAFNTLILIANKEVVDSLMRYHEVTKEKVAVNFGKNYLEEHDKRLRDLIIEMRKDLFGKPSRENDFPKIHLIGKGKSNHKSS